MGQYFLWLTPEKEVYDCLAGLINQLCQQYRGPQFEPHITLLGEIEGDEPSICQQTHALVRNLQPLKLHFLEPAYAAEYFRCLYYKVDETSDILNVHQQARQVFGKKKKAPFHPHVSLLYGLFPLRVKQDIINSLLPADLPKTFMAPALKLIRAESSNPQDWHLVKLFQLKSS